MIIEMKLIKLKISYTYHFFKTKKKKDWKRKKNLHRNDSLKTSPKFFYIKVRKHSIFFINKSRINTFFSICLRTKRHCLRYRMCSMFNQNVCNLFKTNTSICFYSVIHLFIYILVFF